MVANGTGRPGGGWGRGARVAIVHDYLTQRGGAERVVLSMLKAFPDATIHTSLYHPEGTFAEFRDAEVRTLPLNRVALLRHHHRLAFPLLAPAFSRLEVDADVVLCDSSGWAHGAQVRGRKVVYCHTPARWLYNPRPYLRSGPSVGQVALAVMGRHLRRWDRTAASTAHRYLTGSQAVRTRIGDTYGLPAEVLPSPPGVEPTGPHEAIPGLEPGYFLVVARLLPYKNVAAVVSAFAELPELRLVVVGTGPEEHTLRAAAGPNVRLVGGVKNDGQLRWLYANCEAIVAAAYEDQGLIPLEAAGFGKPTVALRWGGFLDTIVDGDTGLFFEEPVPAAIAGAVRRGSIHAWNPERITAHAELYSERRFINRLQEIVEEELASCG